MSSAVNFRKGFFLHDTHSPLYDMIKISHWVGWGARACVHLVLRACIWKALAVSLVLPAQWVLLRPGSMVPPWMTASGFLAGKVEAELKPTTFSSFLLFMFSCLFSSPDPPAI